MLQRLPGGGGGGGAGGGGGGRGGDAGGSAGPQEDGTLDGQIEAFTGFPEGMLLGGLQSGDGRAENHPRGPDGHTLV
jgi:hypothetical protein